MTHASIRSQRGAFPAVGWPQLWRPRALRNPLLLSVSPADGASGVATTSNIVLSFSEAIQRGTGTIEIRSGSATGTRLESFNVASSTRISLSGSTVTIDPVNTLAANSRYFVVIPAGAFRNLAGAGYTGTSSYDFTTVDTLAPRVSSFSPADGATGVSPTSNIVITFNEAIQRGSGLIRIRSGSATGTVIESFDAATSGRLSLSGTRLTIDPTNNLAGSTRYFVTFAAGTIRDLAGNGYGGTSAYDFRTAALDTAAPLISSWSPADGSTGVDPAATFTVGFNETIQRGSGLIELRSGSASGTVIESFDAATSDRLTLSGSQLSIDPVADLAFNTTVVLVLPAGSVRDLAGNSFAGSSTYDVSTAGPFNPLTNPLYPQQWHLRNTGQGNGTPGIDANVELAWSQAAESGGILGRNVTIAVVDDGLQRTHPDLQANYLAAASYDYNFNDSDPSPGSADSHGTAVAGVAAAVGFNSVGVSGVAPRANLSGIRLIAGAASDAMEASALTHALQLNSIYSNSWGPSDSGTLLAAIGPQARQALYTGVTTGRNGKGAIYTWAGGNGYQAGDNSNYDGYANSPYVIAVGAINNYGKRASYSESGANLLVSAPSSGGSLGIVTTDLTGSSGYNGLTDTSYTNQFGGTSSATPLVSGVVALMLEANPELTWRDVMHILVSSARQVDASSAGWQTNGAGHSFHHDYGHGMVDAAAAVSLARSWTPIQPLATPIALGKSVNQAIPDNGGGSVSSTLSITDNLRIESVEILFNATHTYRGDLEILLTSPSGSTSVLATRHNDSNDNYSNWTFSSRVHWDEWSQGDWTLTVTDRAGADVGTLLNWGLTINGTAGPAPTSTSSSSRASTTDPQAIDAEQLATRLMGQPAVSEAATSKATAALALAAAAPPDPLIGPWGGIAAGLSDQLPHLDAYIASIEERIATGAVSLQGTEWTVATYGGSTAPLDAITGLQRTVRLPAGDLAMGAADSLLAGAKPGTPLDTFQVAFEPEQAPGQIATDLASVLGNAVAFYYPTIALQQTPRSALPWVESADSFGQELAA